MEWFSHIHPATPIVLFVPVIVWMLYVASADRGLSWGTILGLFLVGIIYWTLVEYLLHRFVFHYEPKSEWGKRLHFTMHGVHHDYPNDSTRLVMAPAISIPLAFFFLLRYPSRSGKHPHPSDYGWIGLRLRLLRHAPLRHPSPLHETGCACLSKKAASAPPLRRRQHRLRRDLAAVGYCVWNKRSAVRKRRLRPREAPCCWGRLPLTTSHHIPNCSIVSLRLIRKHFIVHSPFLDVFPQGA
ncbi:MAG: fatty acid hydroxylase [Chlorobi bacterium OLB7]|nr:MAG: fatty acid hydroxylase [Chlorobi bacterium OLB7]